MLKIIPLFRNLFGTPEIPSVTDNGSIIGTFQISANRSFYLVGQRVGGTGTVASIPGPGAGLQYIVTAICLSRSKFSSVGGIGGRGYLSSPGTNMWIAYQNIENQVNDWPRGNFSPIAPYTRATGLLIPFPENGGLTMGMNNNTNSPSDTQTMCCYGFINDV